MHPFRDDLPSEQAVDDFLALHAESRLWALQSVVSPSTLLTEGDLNADERRHVVKQQVSGGLLGAYFFGSTGKEPSGGEVTVHETPESAINARIQIHRARVKSHAVTRWLSAERSYRVIERAFEASSRQPTVPDTARAAFAPDRLRRSVVAIMLSGLNRYREFVEGVQPPARKELIEAKDLIDRLLEIRFHAAAELRPGLEAASRLTWPLLEARAALAEVAPGYVAPHRDDTLPSRVFATRAAQIFFQTFGYVPKAVIANLIAWRGLPTVTDQALDRWIAAAKDRVDKNQPKSPALAALSLPLPK